MDQLQTYLELLRNGAYGAIIAAILSGVNLIILIAILFRLTEIEDRLKRQVATKAEVPAPFLSADGHWQWDGHQWKEVQT